MKYVEEDQDYLSLITHILNNEEFNKIKEIEHHGVSRYSHSLKVSYYSYRIAKVLHLDYQEVARGGLLHDFFLSEEDRTQKDRFISTFVHPKKAVNNSERIFGLTPKEQDIIRTHMFPINIAVPKYMESWVVNFVDKSVGLSEFSKKFKYQFAYASNLMVIFLINLLK